jgi:beta-1,4-mannosyltransferase
MAAHVSGMSERCRAVFFWEQGGIAIDHPRVNPYGGLLARGLASHGVILEPGWEITPEWVRAQHPRVQVLHLNWVHKFYAHPDPAERRRRFRAFAAGLLQARRLGIRIVWTMHNLYPHETHDAVLDRQARRLVCRLAHAVIAHCPHAAGLLAAHFGRRRDVYVIPHGHFIDAYPHTVGRPAARRALDLPDDAFVYVFFGNIRAYKGVERLLETFATLPGDDLRLVIAGRVHPNYGGPLSADAPPVPDRRILFRPGEVAIEEVPLLFNAADVAVLPFLDTLTSGSAITALGFGCPLVVPAAGCLPELVGSTAAGVLYDATAPDGLRDALLRARGAAGPSARAAALAQARALDWAPIARQTLAAYGLVAEAGDAR